jgi:hypothetical protein
MLLNSIIYNLVKNNYTINNKKKENNSGSFVQNITRICFLNLIFVDK